VETLAKMPKGNCTRYCAPAGSGGGRGRATPLCRQSSRSGGVAGAVDEFFERVMVMDENIERRNNRLALLRDVQRLLGGVADLSRLPG